MRKSARSTSAAQVFAATARAIVESQRTLDERGRDSIVRWQENGIPPAVFAWSHVRLTLPVSVTWCPRSSAGARTELLIAPRMESHAKVSIGFTFLVRAQDEDSEP